MEFSPLLKVIRVLAAHEASRAGFAAAEIEHLMLGLCKLEDHRVRDQLKGRPELDQAEAEIAALLRIFDQIGLDPVQLRRALRRRIRRTGYPGRVARARLPLAPTAQLLLDQAARLAANDGSARVGAAHLLAALGADPGVTLTEVLRDQGVHPEELRRYVGARAQATTVGSLGAITYRSAVNDPHSLIPLPGPSAMTSRAIERLRALYTIGQVLISVKDAGNLFVAVMREMQLVMPMAEAGAMMILDANGRLIRQGGWPDSTAVPGISWAERAMRKREAFIWSALQPPDTATPQTDLRPDVQSAIYAPLIYAGHALGVLYLANSAQHDAFDPDDLDLARVIAAQTAIVLHNFNLQIDRQRLMLLRVNLWRHMPPALAEQLIVQLSMPGARSDWNVPATVIALSLVAPVDLPGAQRLRQHNEIATALGERLIQAGALISRGVRDEPLVAVFHPLQPHDSPAALVLRYAWFLLSHPLPAGWALGIGLDLGEVTQRIVTAAPAHRDEFSHYEVGLHKAFDRIGHGHAAYLDLLAYEQQLDEAIRSARLYGDTSERKAERARITHQLNQLLIAHLSCSFRDLCPPALDVAPATIAAEYSVAGPPVDGAIALARLARDQLWLSAAAHRALGAYCSGEPVPEYAAFAVSALVE